MSSQNAPHWKTALKAGSNEERVETLREICGHDGVTEVTTAVVALSGSSHDDVRMWAAEALERTITPTANDVTPLIEQLKTALESAEDGEISYWAATMLGRLGGDASGAAEALRGCLDDSMYLPARERAVWALCQIGDAAAIAKESLQRVAKDSPPRLKHLANEALRRLEKAA